MPNSHPPLADRDQHFEALPAPRAVIVSRLDGADGSRIVAARRHAGKIEIAVRDRTSLASKRSGDIPRRWLRHRDRIPAHDHC